MNDGEADTDMPPVLVYLLWHLIHILYTIFFVSFLCVHITPPSRHFTEEKICEEQVRICDKSSNDAQCGFCQERSSDCFVCDS